MHDIPSVVTLAPPVLPDAAAATDAAETASSPPRWASPGPSEQATTAAGVLPPGPLGRPAPPAASEARPLPPPLLQPSSASPPLAGPGGCCPTGSSGVFPSTTHSRSECEELLTSCSEFEFLCSSDGRACGDACRGCPRGGARGTTEGAAQVAPPPLLDTPVDGTAATEATSASIVGWLDSAGDGFAGVLAATAAAVAVDTSEDAAAGSSGVSGNCSNLRFFWRSFFSNVFFFWS
mmetsp:Transcript_63127/g.163823  ORF Transcript_63127/g.163823 Transcript_63127/m.163823 type:complete len:235 (+) Transcript_63127:298-1002(+)